MGYLTSLTSTENLVSHLLDAQKSLLLNASLISPLFILYFETLKVSSNFSRIYLQLKLRVKLMSEINFQWAAIFFRTIFYSLEKEKCFGYFLY